MVHRRNSGRWVRQLVDDAEIAEAGCNVADTDGDGDLDFNRLAA